MSLPSSRQASPTRSWHTLMTVSLIEEKGVGVRLVLVSFFTTPFQDLTFDIKVWFHPTASDRRLVRKSSRAWLADAACSAIFISFNFLLSSGIASFFFYFLSDVFSLHTCQMLAALQENLHWGSRRRSGRRDERERWVKFEGRRYRTEKGKNLAMVLHSSPSL